MSVCRLADSRTIFGKVLRGGNTRAQQVASGRVTLQDVGPKAYRDGRALR
jgi:hypothetical protein